MMEAKRVSVPVSEVLNVTLEVTGIRRALFRMRVGAWFVMLGASIGGFNVELKDE